MTFTPHSPGGLRALLTLDDSFIGTPDYMGITYFWHYDFRHYLRDATPYRRRLVHKHLLAAGLAPDGNSADHAAIVKRFIRPRNY